MEEQFKVTYYQNSTTDDESAYEVRPFWTQSSYLHGSVTITMFVLASVMIYFLYKNRNVQPLKKKSPLLIIISVFGNFLVVLNICGCFLFFQSFANAQNDCIYRTDNWDSNLPNTNTDEAKKCLSNWTETQHFWRALADWNGYSIFAFSEPLAILPYLIRSLRI